MPRHPANFHSVAQVLWPNRVPMRLEPEKPLGSAQSSGLTQFEAPRTPRPTRKLSKSGWGDGVSGHAVHAVPGAGGPDSPLRAGSVLVRADGDGVVAGPQHSSRLHGVDGGRGNPVHQRVRGAV